MLAGVALVFPGALPKPADLAMPGGPPVPRALAMPGDLAIGLPPIRARDGAIEAIVASMSTEEKLGQLIVAGIAGTSARPGTSAARLVSRFHLGGVILRTGNLADPGQVKTLTRDLQAASSKVPLLIAVDHEGGRVWRFGPPVTRLPTACRLGMTADPDLAARAGRVAGRELAAMGINMTLAPVLDVNDAPGNPVIGDRSLGPDPQLAADLGVAELVATEAQGVITTLKHFPGHGHASADSHVGLPVVDRTRAELDDTDLLPFRAAIDAGAGAVMTAHVLYPALDPDQPATLSRPILTDLLRTELGFRGLVITDSIGMQAIANTVRAPEAAVQAVIAGADLVLATGAVPEIIAALRDAVDTGRLTLGRLHMSVSRILAAKLAHAARWADPPPRSVVGQVSHRDVMADIDSAAAAVRDAAAPRAGRPTARFAGVATVSGTSIPVVIGWAAMDDRCQIARFQLQARVGGGSWRERRLPSPTSREVTVQVIPGQQLQFRVRATDTSGKLSAWAEGRLFRVHRFQSSDPRTIYAGTWVSLASSSADGGGYRRTVKDGATARITLRGSEVIVIGRHGPDEGRALFTADNVAPRAVGTRRPSLAWRQVVFRRSFVDNGDHLLVVRGLGTANGPGVSVDSFLTLSLEGP